MIDESMASHQFKKPSSEKHIEKQSVPNHSVSIGIRKKSRTPVKGTSMMHQQFSRPFTEAETKPTCVSCVKQSLPDLTAASTITDSKASSPVVNLSSFDQQSLHGFPAATKAMNKSDASHGCVVEPRLVDHSLSHQKVPSTSCSILAIDHSFQCGETNSQKTRSLVKPTSITATSLPDFHPVQHLLPKPKSKGCKEIKHQYSLQDFTSKLKTPPMDKSFRPEKGVIYHKQWIECSATILDELGGRVRAQRNVEVSSDAGVDFRPSRMKKGRLHFNMRSKDTGNIIVSIQIDNFTVTKELCVISNPCSSNLSDMTIEKFAVDSTNEFLYRVFIFDVFGEPLLPKLGGKCELQAYFQSTENKVHAIEKGFECGQVCYDISVSGERPWSQDLVVRLNGKRVSHAVEFEFTDKECNHVDDLDDEDYKWFLKTFDEGDYGITFPLSTGKDDGEFLTYDESNCYLRSSEAKKHELVCKNVRKCDILGADFAHVNNIKRVLDTKDRIEINETRRSAIIDLKNIQSHLHPMCKQVVQHLHRGLYYRKKASEAARVRMEWKERVNVLYEVLLDSESPSFKICEYFKDFFGGLLNRYNREACDELYKFFNFQRDESEVDLHGLLVADEKKLELLKSIMLFGPLDEEEMIEILNSCGIKSRIGYETQTFKKMLRKKKLPKSKVEDFMRSRLESKSGEDSSKYSDLDLESSDDDDCGYVDTIINNIRRESDEAIRKLEEKLESFKLNEAMKDTAPWLEIIVGAGHHSRKNEQNIRPKVEKFLKKKKLQFTAVNKGALVVTFKRYTGPEPCFGEYYCEDCDHCWKSSKSYVGKYQRCSHCKVDCWPVKQREKENVVNYSRDGDTKRKSRPHQASLCQKCQELGHPCNEEDFDYDSEYY